MEHLLCISISGFLFNNLESLNIFSSIAKKEKFTLGEGHIHTCRRKRLYKGFVLQEPNAVPYISSGYVHYIRHTKKIIGIRRGLHMGIPEKFLEGRDHVLSIAYSQSDSLLYPQISTLPGMEPDTTMIFSECLLD